MADCLVIRGVDLLDVDAGEVLEGRQLLIANGAVEAVLRAAEPTPDGARVLDLSGLTILPGLIDCHSHLIGDMEFAGGRRFETKRYFDEIDDDPVRPPAEAARLDPPSFVTSPNITQDPSGIPYFDEAIFIQTIRTGRVAGRRPLTRAMLWFEFRKLTDDDLGAIFEFLRSVPPVRHRVNNADPPTYCPRCGRRHGLGELNSP